MNKFLLVFFSLKGLGPGSNSPGNGANSSFFCSAGCGGRLLPRLGRGWRRAQRCGDLG